MVKILATPKAISDVDLLLDAGVDGFIIGIKDFSIFHNFELMIEQLTELLPYIKKRKKEIFISLNKIINNKDIPLLKEYLLILDKMDIDGIMFGDISIVNLKQQLNLNIPLVWNQLHLPTNYYACNFWYEKGINYGQLSTGITMDEIIEIKQNTNMKLMVSIYGYLPIFESNRSLISNYFKYIKQEKLDNSYYMHEKITNQTYPMYEFRKGTYILSSHILNALEELPKLYQYHIDYVIINGLNIDSHSFIKVATAFVKASNNITDTEAIKQLSKEVDSYSKKNTSKGFFYKETIYKVKTNE